MQFRVRSIDGSVRVLRDVEGDEVPRPLMTLDLKEAIQLRSDLDAAIRQLAAVRKKQLVAEMAKLQAELAQIAPEEGTKAAPVVTIPPPADPVAVAAAVEARLAQTVPQVTRRRSRRDDSDGEMVL